MYHDIFNFSWICYADSFISLQVVMKKYYVSSAFKVPTF